MSITDDYLAAIARFNAGDLDGYLDFYSDDVVYAGATPEPLDKAGMRTFHEDFWAVFPGGQVEVLDHVEAGDKLAARLVTTVRQTGGDFMGVPPAGKEASFAQTTILTVRDGRCVERWTTIDMLGLMTQLGAVPAPA
jgi:predicted ester cyclase